MRIQVIRLLRSPSERSMIKVIKKGTIMTAVGGADADIVAWDLGV